MAKDLDALNDAYTEILGEGTPITDDVGDEGEGRADDAYANEDYSDEAGDGIDPRENVDENDDIEDDDNDGDDDYLGTGSDDEDGKEDDDDEEFEDIPERLINAARASNLGDDAIEEIASTRPEVLEALARAHETAAQRFRQNAKKDDSAEDDSSDDDTGFKPLKLEFDEDDEEEMGSKALKVIRTLEAQINKLGGQVQEQSKSLGNVQQQGQAERVRQIDSFFDRMAKEVPELGKTGSLTDRQKRNRIFAARSAHNAMQIYGDLDEEAALAMGARTLTGTKRKAQVKNEIIGDLDRNKKRFTSRGSSRQRPKKKLTVEERAMAALNKEMDKIEAGA